MHILGLGVFNASFNNISVISWRKFYWWKKPVYPVKTIVMIDLSYVTSKVYHIMFYRVHLAISEIQTHNVTSCIGSCK